MKILSFDTAGEFCSVALHLGKELVAFEQDITLEANSAELLIPMIDKVMQIAKFKYDELNYIAFTKGPGSFTGIRVSLSAAQGMLVASKVEPLAFSSFELWNYRCCLQAKTDANVVIIRAYSGEVYVQIFEDSKQSEPMLLGIKELKVLLLTKFSGKTVALTGSAIGQLDREIYENSNFLFLPRFVNAKSLGYLAFDVISGSIPESYKDISPLYIKPPSVNVSKEKIF